MYADLRITNFRGFSNFTMSGLGRINLLVGPNNCGKSTVLEAIDLLSEIPDPVVVGMKCIDRGAVAETTDQRSNVTAKIVLRHLFHGHRADAGTSFVIAGMANGAEQQLRVSITTKPTQPPTGNAEQAGILGRLWLETEKTGLSAPMLQSVQLTGSAEWSFGDFRNRLDAVSDLFVIPVISTSAVSRKWLMQGLAETALNPDEALILDVLRLLEPKIEGIVAIPTPSLRAEDDRSGIFVKLKGQLERTPIGSLGEGIWRLLGLAISLVQARGKIILIDEIDIGLHYSVQGDMWRMVKQAAETLDVQVFASTHSRDCVEALAQIARPNVTEKSDITIQRIEGDHAVAYNERELSLAAERGIEVR